MIKISINEAKQAGEQRTNTSFTDSELILQLRVLYLIEEYFKARNDSDFIVTHLRFERIGLENYAYARGFKMSEVYG